MKFLSLFGKNSNFSEEYKGFKKGIERNPNDYGLKVRFIKFCLLNRFANQETIENHIPEVLALFETIENAEAFDLQCHYLVGKYYQEDKDYRKAYQVYLNAVKRFNRYVDKHPNVKSDNSELAYSVALNLIILQSDPVDPEVEKCFKNIHKSFPLHVKRVEVENEMAKPAPDKERIKQLAEEIRQLKAAEGENESLGSTKDESAEALVFKPRENDESLTRLFRVPSPSPEDFAALKADIKKAQITSENDNKDFFSLSPIPESFDQSASFMVFQNNDWEGPFTLSQLRSNGPLNSNTWVCRVGSQVVVQAYEVPDLHSVIQ